MEGRKGELSLHPVRLDVVDGFLFVAFDDTLPPAAEALGSLPKEWSGYDPANLVCTRRKTWDVKANWKLWYENYNNSLHVPFVHPGSLAKQKVKSRQRASHVETDGAYIAHFTVHGGSRGLLEEDQGMALPRFPSLSGRYAEGTYYPCLLPATLFGFTVDCVWVFELYPEGARPHDAGCRLALLQGADAASPTSQRRPPTTTAASMPSCRRTTRRSSASRRVCACRSASRASSRTWRPCATLSTTGCWTRWSTA